MVVYNVEEQVVNQKDEEVSSPLEEEPPSSKEEEQGVSDIEGYDDNSIPPPSIKFVDALNTTTINEVKNSVEGAYLSSEFAGVKWLRNKPLHKFDDAQWLLIRKAEDEKLLQVTIKLPEEVLNKLISNSHEKYLSYGVSKFAQLWNEQRKLILQDAIFNHILPSLEKEARSLLATKAKTGCFWISVAPYQRKENDLSSDDEAAPRVMACCWGPGKPSTTFVMLDSYGEIVDVLEAGSISLRSQNVNDQQRKKMISRIF
ncbi:Transcription elongation factor spt6 [Ancistrocladus abbreviatus]